MPGPPLHCPGTSTLTASQSGGPAAYLRVANLTKNFGPFTALKDVSLDVALGEFVGCNPRSPEEPTVEAVLHERFAKLGVPVLSGLPFGHGRRNLAAPLGAPVVLDATAGTLCVLPRA